MNTGNFFIFYHFPWERTAVGAGTYNQSKMQKIGTIQSIVKGMLPYKSGFVIVELWETSNIWWIVDAFRRIGLI